MPELLSSKLPRQAIRLPSTLVVAFMAVLTIAGLYFAREVLVPIALALLLSFVLSPAVRLLRSLYFPRLLAVIVVGILAFAAISALAAVIGSQVNQLAADLPSYQSTLREKIQNLRGASKGTGALERASEVLQDLKKEIEPSKGGTSTRPLTGRASPERPIPVEVRQPDPGALQTLAVFIAPLIPPLTTAGIVVIFVIFMLLQRQDLRNRLVRLAGAQDLQRTTAALDDAGQRLSRLFLTQLALNAVFGLVIGFGLWLIGVPSAPLWGVLAMILRFVPYLGAPIAAIFPLILAAAVDPGWTMVVLTLALFLIVEPLVGHVIEPLVYGQSTGLSPLAVIASATFWTWLWGPIGLILATPLTMCLVVVGRHVDRLKFLEVLFGDQPPLTPPQLFYQRILARDPVEAAEQAETFLKEKPLTAYYDEILLEGLRLAEADVVHGLLDEERLQRIRDAVAEIVDDLSTHKDKNEKEGAPSQLNKAESPEPPSPLLQLDKAEALQRRVVLREQWRRGTPVLCVPGMGLLDEAAAIVVAQLVEREGISARPERADTLSMSQIFSWDTKDAALICLCYVKSVTSAQIRYAVRRVRRKAPEAIILVALFGANNTRFESEEPGGDTEFVQPSFRATVDKIVAAASAPCADHSLAEPVTAAVV